MWAVRRLAWICVMFVGCLDDPKPLQPDLGAACIGGLAGMAVINVGSVAGLLLNTTPGAGEFHSEAFSLGAPVAFERLVWRPQRPYGRALPVTQDPPFPEGRLTQANLLYLAHFDETSGTEFQDASGNGHSVLCMAPSVCPSPAPGRFHGGLHFSNGAVLVGLGQASLEPQHVTVEGWVFPTGPLISGDSTMMIVTKGRNPMPPFGSYSIEFDPPSGNRARCYASPAMANPLIGQTALPLNQWHHLACTWDGAVLRVYADGRLDGSDATLASGPIQYSGFSEDELLIGRWGRNASQRTVGRIDEIAIYSEALDQATIEDHYLRGALRLGLRIRGCDQPPCTGAFLGPDGTGNSVFDESCDPEDEGGARALPLSGYDCSDGSHANGAAFPTPLRFWQYQALLESDDANASPDLRDVQFCR
jgi:hypothetical protein